MHVVVDAFPANVMGDGECGCASRVRTYCCIFTVLPTIFSRDSIPAYLRKAYYTMDKLKGLSKGGWHPPGDPSISRKTWKTDLKGMATGKKHDPNEEKLNHESRPLASLRDRESM